MAKIEQSLGFTFRVGSENSNQYARVFLGISDIDTELPIEPQLEKVNEATKIVWEHLKGKLDDQIESILDEVGS